MKEIREYHFKVTATEEPLHGDTNLGTAKISVQGSDYKAGELLALCMSGNEQCRDIIRRALGRYARANPEWWQVFKTITDLQIADPPRLQ